MGAHRMDAETVERLLAGPVPDAQVGPNVLVRLLDALRAAPRPHELVGETAALQAFRIARASSGPVVASHLPSPRRPLQSPPAGAGAESAAAVEADPRIETEEAAPGQR